MVLPLRNRTVRVGTQLAALSIFGLLLLHVSLRAYITWCVREHSPNSLRRAIQLDPDNCEAYSELGILEFYLQALDPSEMARAETYVRRAVKCEPLNGDRWRDLANILEASGKVEEAISAMETAHSLAPRNALFQWDAANILLRHGKLKQAFGYFRQALSGYPDYATITFGTLWKATDDGDAILEDAIPNTVDMDLSYLVYLSSNSKYDESKKVWERLLGHGQPFPVEKCFPYFDALINADRNQQASEAWEQLALSGLLPRNELASRANLINNGGFEEEPANGGLDWRIYPAGGAVATMDRQIRHSGAQSLSIHFEGLSNINFQHILQFVPVAARSEYRFSAYMKSRVLTTSSGVRFEISDHREPRKLHWETEDLLGTSEWREFTSDVQTGPDTKFLAVVLRRRPGLGPGSRIEGTVWVDDVSLISLRGRRAERTKGGGARLRLHSK